MSERVTVVLTNEVFLCLVVEESRAWTLSQSGNLSMVVLPAYTIDFFTTKLVDNKSGISAFIG